MYNDGRQRLHVSTGAIVLYRHPKGLLYKSIQLNTSEMSPRGFRSLISIAFSISKDGEYAYHDYSRSCHQGNSKRNLPTISFWHTGTA